MAALVVPTHRRPPAIYRAARALRWAGAVVFVLLLIFAGTVAYSAVEVARSSPQSHGLSAAFTENSTIEVQGSFTLSNPGLYPIQGFDLTARVLNDSGVLLGDASSPPVTVGPSSSAVIPIALFIPVTSNGPAVSLLTVDQYLEVRAWANTTYAYLFPISVSLTENRSWGAPFQGLTVTLGAPSGGGGMVTLPVTIAFTNQADFTEAGTLTSVVESASATVCGSVVFPLDVPPGTVYDQTEDATLSSGCNPAGGEVVTTFAGNGFTLVLPPEAIP